MKVEVSGTYKVSASFTGIIELPDDWKEHYDSIEEAAADYCAAGDVDITECNNPCGQAEWEDVSIDDFTELED